jgi:hypothetical protein
VVHVRHGFLVFGHFPQIFCSLLNLKWEQNCWMTIITKELRSIKNYLTHFLKQCFGPALFSKRIQIRIQSSYNLTRCGSGSMLRKMS